MIDATILPIVQAQIFYYRHTRFVFHGPVGERLHATDEHGQILTVDDEEIDGEAMPSVCWFLQEYLNGELVIPPASRSEQANARRLEELDIMAATLRDPPCLRRYVWAREAKKAGLKQNEAAVREWIEGVSCPAVPALAWTDPTCDDAVALHTRLTHLFSVKPGARSVMEWVKVLVAGGGFIGPLVNKAGRPLGHSQLTATIDKLVQRASELYYEKPDCFPSIEDAAALVHRWWELLRADGNADVGAEPPDYETIRRRIRKMENFDNYEKRFGRAAALAKFAPKGEPVEVSRPFERVILDGVEFEHYTLYSDEWREVAGKMKGVAAMDAFTLYKWPYALFYGPYRPEMSMQALMNVIVPRQSSAAEIRSDPSRLIFGAPSTLVYDNDRALLPPSMVISLSQLADIELVGVYHPNGKSLLEGSFRHDKSRLALIKGRVRPPSHKHDPRYDPAEEANLTKEQYRLRVEQARRSWNETPKTRLGGRSPNDVMLEYLKRVGVQTYHA